MLSESFPKQWRQEPAQLQDEEVSVCVKDFSLRPFSHTLPTLPRIASTRGGPAAFFSWVLAGRAFGD